jgi:hypothetical protein
MTAESGCVLRPEYFRSFRPFAVPRQERMIPPDVTHSDNADFHVFETRVQLPVAVISLC